MGGEVSKPMHIVTWAWQRPKTCNANEEMYGGLCYPKCNAGYRPAGCCLCEADGKSRIELAQRQYCPPGKRLEAGLCYPVPRDSRYNCTATVCSFSKDVKPGTRLGAPNTCGADQEANAGMCYKKSNAGYTCSATHCQFSKEVRGGTRLGLADACGAGQVKEAGLCYSQPKPGFSCAVTMCSAEKQVKNAESRGPQSYCMPGTEATNGACMASAVEGFTCEGAVCRANTSRPTA